MKKLNRLLTAILSFILVFSCIPINVHAENNIVTYDNWKVDEVIWPDSPLGGSTVDFVFTYTRSVQDLIDSANTVNDSCWHAFKWLEDVYFFNEITRTSYYTDLNKLIKDCKGYTSVDTFNSRNKILAKLESIKDNLTEYDYDLEVFAETNTDETTLVKLINNGQGFTDGGSVEALKWLDDVDSYFKDKRGFAVGDINDIVSNAKSYTSVDTFNCRNKIIGYMVSLLNLPDCGTCTVYKNKAVVMVTPTVVSESTASITLTATASFFGKEYTDTHTYGEEPPIETKYTVESAEWNGSYDVAPTECKMTIKVECGSDISTMQQTTNDITLVQSESDDTKKVYEAKLLYETHTLTARMTYKKPNVHSGTLTATDFTWDLYKDGTIKQMWDKAITLVHHTCQDSNDVAEPISGPGIGTEIDSLGVHTIVWKCKYLTCEQKVTLVNTKPETPTKEYKVIDCKWEGGSFYEAPTKATFTLQNTKDSSDKIIKDTTNISASAISENHIQYEAILLYNDTYYSSFIEFDKPENNEATLTAEPFEWDIYVDGSYASPAFFKKAQSKVTYITSNLDGNSLAWPKSGVGITFQPDGPGEYEIVWTCTEGLEAIQKVTLLDSTPPEVPRPEPIIESPFDPEPSIDETTIEVNLVKGQKFTKYGWSLINGSDKQYLSISKKGVFTAKKNTSKSVLITNGTQTVSVNIVTPEYSKKETMNVGQNKVMSFSIDNTKYTVSWSSSNVDVATISNSGLITAVGKGTATITAHVNGKKYNCKLTVKEPTTAVNRTLHINVGSSKTFKVKGIKNWTASDNIVAVNKNKIKALNVGTTTLTAEKDGITYKTTVIVEDPSIKNEDVTISKKKYNLMIAEGHTLPITVANVDRIVTFSSNKPSVAYVNENGELVAKNAGKAKLTTKINGKTITINVTVTNSFEVIDFD